MDRKNLQDTAPRLPIGMLSRRTGCNIETIRYYEKIGLLPAPARSDGGHRLYGHGHLMRLGFVRRARELGFTLDEIRALLRLAEDRDRPCRSEEHTSELQSLMRISYDVFCLKKKKNNCSEVLHYTHTIS